MAIKNRQCFVYCLQSPLLPFGKRSSAFQTLVISAIPSKLSSCMPLWSPWDKGLHIPTWVPFPKTCAVTAPSIPSLLFIHSQLPLSMYVFKTSHNPGVGGIITLFSEMVKLGIRVIKLLDLGHTAQMRNQGTLQHHKPWFNLPPKFSWAPKSLQMVTAVMKLKDACSLLLKNWCFWTVVLKKILERPLDCKEIKPVHPKGNQSWIFIGRTDAEAETPILWPPDAKNWLIGKDPDAGRIEGWRRKGQEGEMIEWAPPTRWTWVWASSGSWWWTGKPGMPQWVAKSWTWLSD